MSNGKKTALAIVSVKNLLLAVERRSNAASNCCPNLIDDAKDEGERLWKLGEAQREVDTAVKGLREATAARFADFSDAEVILLAHIWAGLWSSDSALRLDSNDLDRVAGWNNPEALEDLIKGLLEGRSPVLNFISMVWTNNHGTGYYSFILSNPNRLHRLIIGDVAIV